MRSDLSGTIQSRLFLWETAIENLQTPVNLILGADARQVAAQNFDKLGWDFPHSHMTYLNNALYFGLPALLLFCAGLYRGIVTAARGAARIRSPLGRIYSRAVLAALVTSAGIAVLESTAEPSRFGIVFVMLGLSAAIARSHKPDDRRRSETPRRLPARARLLAGP